jgi:hypothetical protein
LRLDEDAPKRHFHQRFIPFSSSYLFMNIKEIDVDICFVPVRRFIKNCGGGAYRQQR